MINSYDVMSLMLMFDYKVEQDSSKVNYYRSEDRHGHKIPTFMKQDVPTGWVCHMKRMSNKIKANLGEEPPYNFVFEIIGDNVVGGFDEFLGSLAIPMEEFYALLCLGRENMERHIFARHLQLHAEIEAEYQEEKTDEAAETR